METDLRARIISAVPVVGTRVHWGIAPPKATLPYIVLATVSDVRAQHMKGFAKYQPKRVQIDCYAATYDQSVAMREAVIAGLVPPAVQGLTRFLRAFINNTMGRGQDTTNGYVHRQMVDLTLWHN